MTDLESHHLVGRSRAMHTRIDAPEVSAQHAALSWTGEMWVVRDLGSRNGTWLDGRRIAALPEPLARGAVLWFGDARIAWTLTDTSAPVPLGRRGDVVVRGDGEMLALPSEEEPLAVITHEAGRWSAECDGEPRPVAHGDTLEVGGESWRLSLPELLVRTIEARPVDSTGSGLRFAVSANQEYVEVTARDGATALPLKPRAHHEALLALARVRLDDQRQNVTESEQGWVYTSDLARELGVSRNRLYVMLHRCRRDLEGMGLCLDPIDRRATTQQMRLAVADVEITRL